MYAVIETGGKQYRVSPGETIRVEKMSAEPGATVTLGKVLLFADENEVKVGNPFLDAATVEGTVLRHGREPKVYIFHYKRKKNYRKFRGHRQDFTEVRIDAVRG
ncbi:MAG: 50S ribosomal protein L21 [Synergistaceae bacterium]|jgi:large subunit ribosomal protein L21|nr:50S ribosomal protein L21 [Synergistaceae bacterium]